MSDRLRIEGTCDSAFRKVREVFGDNFDTFDEIGASVSVVIEGRCVVDLWGGFQDAERHRSWEGGTVVNVFSTTKALATLCVLRLVQAGRIDLQAPIAEYWPEFAAHGKGDVTVADCLSHRAGVPAYRETHTPEDLYDLGQMGTDLAATRPWWEPGTRHGYHALTFGWFASELIGRLTGKTVGDCMREVLARPLEVDLFLGLPADEDHRTADVVGAPSDSSLPDLLLDELRERPDGMTALAFNNPPLPFSDFNARNWRGAQIPAANGHTNARALARIYGALVHGGKAGDVPVLEPEILDAALEERSFGPDAVLWDNPTRFGVGFMLGQEERRFAFGPTRDAFGHPGMGGSLGMGDRDARVGFGYTMNLLRSELLIDERPARLLDAIYESL